MSETLGTTFNGFSVQGRAPIAFEELVAGMQVVFGARESLGTGGPVERTPYRIAEELA